MVVVVVVVVVVLVVFVAGAWGAWGICARIVTDASLSEVSDSH